MMEFISCYLWICMNIACVLSCLVYCSKKRDTEPVNPPKNNVNMNNNANKNDGPKSKRCNTTPGLLNDDPDLRSVDCTNHSAENVQSPNVKSKIAKPTTDAPPMPSPIQKVLTNKNDDPDTKTDLRSFVSEKPKDGGPPTSLKKTQELSCPSKMKGSNENQKKLSAQKMEPTQMESVVKPVVDDGKASPATAVAAAAAGDKQVETGAAGKTIRGTGTQTAVTPTAVTPPTKPGAAVGAAPGCDSKKQADKTLLMAPAKTQVGTVMRDIQQTQTLQVTQTTQCTVNQSLAAPLNSKYVA